MDVVAAFRPMTKWTVEVHDVARIPELLQRAIRTSVSGRPGPVVVSLPLDVLQATVPADLRPAARRRSYRPAPAPEAIAEAMRVLADSRRPVVILGGGAIGGPDVYLRLAELLQSPLVTTWMRQSVVPHDAPH
jgi:acetolactate synthase-1/2/3 large subunit